MAFLKSWGVIKIVLIFLMFGLLAYFNNPYATGLGGFFFYVGLEAATYFINKKKLKK